MVISDEGNNGPAEATFKFPGPPGGNSIPLSLGQSMVLAVDATGSMLPRIDFDFYGGGTDTDSPTVPNLTKLAGSGVDLLMSNSGDGITLSKGYT